MTQGRLGPLPDWKRRLLADAFLDDDDEEERYEDERYEDEHYEDEDDDQDWDLADVLSEELDDGLGRVEDAAA